MDFDSVWKKINLELGIKNYSQLAKILNTTSSNVTKKKQKNDFPIEWAYALGEKYGVTVEWILTGKEQKNRETDTVQKNAQEKEEIETDCENRETEGSQVDCYFNGKFIKRVQIIEGGLYEVDPINPSKKKMKGEKVVIIDKGFVGPTVCLRIESNWHLKRREYIQLEPCDLKLISKNPDSEELKRIVLENIEKYKSSKD